MADSNYEFYCQNSHELPPVPSPYRGGGFYVSQRSQERNCLGLYTPAKIIHGKQVRGEGPDSAWFNDPYDDKEVLNGARMLVIIATFCSKCIKKVEKKFYKCSPPTIHA